MPFGDCSSPSAATIAILTNPTNANADTEVDETQAAARTLGVQVQVLPAANEREIDAVFAAVAQNRPGAIFVAGDETRSITRRLRLGCAFIGYLQRTL